MKRPADAISLDKFKLSQADFDAIQQEVLEGLAFRRSAAFPAALVGAEARGDRAGAAAAPATNRGGKSVRPNFEAPREEIAARLVLEDGEVKEIPARRSWGGGSAFLDWVNVVTDESDFFLGKIPLNDDELMRSVSLKCEEIFGFGITQKRAGGANFYDDSYILGDNYGMVCHGGQRDTLLIMVSGEGCCAAKFGWEKRLYDFLNTCGIRAKLSRVDLAHDIYDGVNYSVDRADTDFDANLFNCGGRNPNHEQRGNWKQPNGKGRTLYIGNRKNGKFCRVYEKGKQLGDKNSEWVRVEVEMKSISRIIPFEVLLNPGQYLAATYPALAWIEEEQHRITTVQKKTEITYQSMVAWLKRQAGAAINVMLAIEGDAETLVQKIIRDAIPSRLKVPGWQFVDGCIHDHPRNLLSKDEFDVLALA